MCTLCVEQKSVMKRVGQAKRREKKRRRVEVTVAAEVEANNVKMKGENFV